MYKAYFLPCWMIDIDIRIGIGIGIDIDISSNGYTLIYYHDTAGNEI